MTLAGVNNPAGYNNDADLFPPVEFLDETLPGPGVRPYKTLASETLIP